MSSQIFKQILLNAPRRFKQSLAVASDIFFCAVASAIAMGLRTDTWFVWGQAHGWMTLVGVIVALPAFTGLGLYRAIFRYAGMQMLYTLIKALLIYTALFVLLFMLIGVASVPRSMGVMQPVVFGFGVVASRLFVRRWLGGLGAKRRRVGVPRALIYGAGSAGRQLATGMTHAAEVVVTGYVDDDALLHGRVLNGLPIFAPQHLADAVIKHGVTQIYLALPSVSRRRRNEIIQSLIPLKLQVRTLPGLMDLTHGKVEVSDLKELDIEDLLGRDPVPPNAHMLSQNNAGKVVLVTGAGGSIGSELCRQILQTGPSKLLLVELTEFALYAIEQDLRRTMVTYDMQGVELIPLLADVRSATRMAEIMRTWRPHTVYHAAAYKHVPLVEHNPAEGVRNNVRGTWVTAEQAMANGVADFVLISTDKAVRPTNVMGASKRLAEMVLQALAQQTEQNAQHHGRSMRLSMVRFGNVLGSSGSVVPLFRRQIQQGGPITLTDARITRYFMTIPEAAQLVIQAGAMAQGGDVFVLDMGESVKIIDLARKMIELSGLTVQDADNLEGDIAIEVTGLRPGEKLFEELLIGDNPMPTQHARIMKAHEDFLPWQKLKSKLVELETALDANDVPMIRSHLEDIVTGYQPDGEVVDWVWTANQKTK
jgi:FlaA1/EpsC-like NDP-sugar epimerase